MSDPLSQRPTRIRVDLDAVAGNLRAIRAHVGVPVMGIVKANAYGHGLVQVARHLQAGGVDRLGVAFVEEGIALRRAGITAPILVLGGIFGPQVADFLRHDLEITVSSLDKLRQVEAAAEAMGRKAAIHLKIDTGMAVSAMMVGRSVPRKKNRITATNTDAPISLPCRVVIEVSMKLACRKVTRGASMPAGSDAFRPVSASSIDLVSAILLQAWSRRNEHEADAFAVETTGTGTRLASALRKLAADSLTNLTPHRLYVVLHYSHPPLPVRLRALGG